MSGPVADADLEIRLEIGGGGGWSSRPLDKGGGLYCESATVDNTL